MAARFALNAARQALGASRVDRQVGAGAYAAPLGALWFRMAPGQQAVGRQRLAHAAHSTSNTATSVTCSVAPSVSPV